MNGLDDIFCTKLGRRSGAGSPMVPDRWAATNQMKPRSLTNSKAGDLPLKNHPSPPVYIMIKPALKRCKMWILNTYSYDNVVCRFEPTIGPSNGTTTRTNH